MQRVAYLLSCDKRALERGGVMRGSGFRREGGIWWDVSKKD